MQNRLRLLGGAVIALALIVGLLLSAPPFSAQTPEPPTPIHEFDLPESLDYSSLEQVLVMGREKPGEILNTAYGFSLTTDEFLVSSLVPELPLAKTWELDVLAPDGERLTVTVHDPTAMPSWEADTAVLWSLTAEEQAQSLWERNHSNSAEARDSALPLLQQRAAGASLSSVRETELAERRAYTFFVSDLFRPEGSSVGVLHTPLQVIFIDGPNAVMKLTLPADHPDLLEVAQSLRFLESLTPE